MPTINSTVVKMSKEPNDSCLAISTVNRSLGRNGRFLILADKLERFLESSEINFYDRDCGGWLEIIKSSNEMLRFKFNWTNTISCNFGTFKNQVVDIPTKMVLKALNCEQIKYLYSESFSHPALDFTHSTEHVVEIAKDKHKRRAFSKAMRDYYCNRTYNACTITFYKDAPQESFYFKESSGWSGGLILHSGEKSTKAGSMPYLYYGIHT